MNKPFCRGTGARRAHFPRRLGSFAVMAAFAATAVMATGCGTGASNASSARTADETEPQIAFSNILIQKDGSYTTVLGEVSNSSQEQYSFDVRVSFYNKDQKLLGTASGVVNDLNGGDTKAFTAIASGDYARAASCKAEVESIISMEDNTKCPIEFSGTRASTVSGMTQVDGTAQNTDSKPHSFTVTVCFYDRDGQLLGIATGAVADLAAGGTTPFTAYSTEDDSAAASFKVSLDTLVD